LFGEEPIDSIDVLQGIKRGWLADVKCVQEFTKTDLKGVTMEGDDFEEKSLVETINTPERNAFIVNKWRANLYGQRTIFAASVEVPHHMPRCIIFLGYG
jgi:type I site-specific restriction endonuclease